MQNIQETFMEGKLMTLDSNFTKKHNSTNFFYKTLLVITE